MEGSEKAAKRPREGSVRLTFTATARPSCSAALWTCPNTRQRRCLSHEGCENTQGKGGVSASKAVGAQGNGGVSASKAVEAHGKGGVSASTAVEAHGKGGILATKEVEIQGNGAVLAAEAVEAQGKGAVSASKAVETRLSLDGSGSTGQKRHFTCPTDAAATGCSPKCAYLWAPNRSVLKGGKRTAAGRRKALTRTVGSLRLPVLAKVAAHDLVQLRGWHHVGRGPAWSKTQIWGRI